MNRGGESRGQGPAGLVSLGLIMQLVGSMVAAWLAVAMLHPLIIRVLGGWDGCSGHFDLFGRLREWSRGNQHLDAVAWQAPILLLAGVVRAVLHRRAGSAILHRAGGGLAAVITYVGFALLHTGVASAFLYSNPVPLLHLCTVAAFVGLGWPLCLLIALTRGRFRAALRQGPAAVEPGAPDEIAALMTILGLVGTLVGLFALYAAIEWMASYPSPVPSSMIVAVAVLLLARAVVQLVAGLRGATTGAVRSYVRVSLAASALACVALALRQGVDIFSTITFHAAIACLLVVWPLLLRRASGERPDSRAAAPAASTGVLAGLGWFLLGLSALQLANLIVLLAMGPDGTASLWYWPLVEYHEPWMVVGSRSPGLQLLLLAPQIWTACELVMAGRRRRAAATTYAACASIATILAITGDVTYLLNLVDVELTSVTLLLVYLQFAVPLVVPIATLVLAQHHLRRLDSVRPGEVQQTDHVPSL